MEKLIVKTIVTCSVAGFFGIVGWMAVTLVDVDIRTEKTAVKVDQNHQMIKPMWQEFVNRNSLAEK